MAAGNCMTSSRKGRVLSLPPLVVLLVIAVLALSTRLLPLSLSQYPFNNDALADCAIAADILRVGRIDIAPDRFYYNTHSTITVAYDILLAFASAFIGSIPLRVAQPVIAAVTVLSVCGTYVIARKITDSRSCALTASVVMGLFGTLLFLTGSAWKMSLGFAFLVLLTYAYMLRKDVRMLLLEVLTLAMLVLVHHVVAFLALLFITYLTMWSVFVGIRTRAFGRQRVLDVLLVTVVSMGAAYYYWAASLDRLSFVSLDSGAAIMLGAVLVTGIALLLVLGKRTHVRATFAPVAALLVLALFVYDHFFSLFPYEQGAPIYILALGASYSILVFVAWLGFESAIESKSIYRAVPIGMILPVVTLVLFSALRGMDESSHQIIYRTFDFAGLGMAVGVAVGVRHLARKPRRMGMAVACILAALIVSFPYGYMSGSLVGVRHDTQDYEVDAFGWLDEHLPETWYVRSDERLSHIGMATHNFTKMPYLPQMLDRDVVYPTDNTTLMMEDEWISVGVNDFPRGLQMYTEEHISVVLASSNVVYIGGPSSNNVIVFYISNFGFDTVIEGS